MARVTPLLKQYHKIKSRHSDSILLFRMGDFYETFYQDAEVASKVLGIALTSRPHGKGERVPLAGVPFRSVDSHIAKLVKSGYKVAICEQLEDAKTTKPVVRRDVIEVITPGTVTRSSLLQERRNSYLGAIAPPSSGLPRRARPEQGRGERSRRVAPPSSGLPRPARPEQGRGEQPGRTGSEGDLYGFAYCDLTTGEFWVTELEFGELADELKRIEPKELLVPRTLQDRVDLDLSMPLTPLEPYYFSYDLAYRKLTSHFKVTSLAGFDSEELRLGVGAAGAVLAYLEDTQRRSLPHLTKLSTYSRSQFMVLDPTTRKNLELTEKLNGEEGEGTLLGVIDYTQTPMGARVVRRWLLAPLLDVGRIEERLNAVEELVGGTFLREELRKALKPVTDMERTLGKISTERANGRDLVALRKSLSVLPKIKEVLATVSSTLLSELASELFDFSPLVAEIEKGMVDSPPLTIKDGGLIRDGYSEKLDQLRGISSRGKGWIAELQSRERERTGIGSLKVGYNNVFGYYIEVSKPNLRKVPEDYIRKQTLAGAERFVTPELKEYESQVLTAEEKQKVLEYEIFTGLRKKVAEQGEPIQISARAIGELDCLSSLAQTALLRNYRKPEVGDTREFSVLEGRHPVVEDVLGEGSFVPNDTYMDTRTDQVLLITGPNMSGKSTYLRQVGLIAILAQMGSFVPAKEARLGVIDRVFTRVGASDDLSKGVSTFLAEMSQTANILNNATAKSLVILDEIGRGTSTFDGLAIAWAVVEYIHNHPGASAKTLFATHYFELTQLEKLLPRVKNYSVAVRESGDEVLFLYKLLPGRSDRSYGIQVARMAGMPEGVVDRAKEVLENLESDELTPAEYPRIARGEHAPVVMESPQLGLFAQMDHPLLEELRRLNVENLTPLDALKKLDELKKRLENG